MKRIEEMNKDELLEKCLELSKAGDPEYLRQLNDVKRAKRELEGKYDRLFESYNNIVKSYTRLAEGTLD